MGTQRLDFAAGMTVQCMVIACALACCVSGCHDGPQSTQAAAAIPVVAGFVDEPGVYRTSERWRFQGGVVVGDVRITPAVAAAGTPTQVSMQIEGIRGDVSMTVMLQPPRAASRQVALGGVDAPLPVLPLDPRTTMVVVDSLRSAATLHQVALPPLPQSWHPQQAVVTMELTAAGRRIEAIDGPRTEAGIAILGLLDVDTEPTHVRAALVSSPPTIDGVVDEAMWERDRTTLVDSRHGEPWEGNAGFVVMAWDQEFLYAAASFVDRDVWSTMRDHDDPLWKEEVFELFVFGSAPATRYLELQVSPRGVTFDAKFAAHRKGEPAWDSAWRTAVDLRGTLDNRKDRDKGWSVEVAVPWTEICEHTAMSCPPQPGGTLRINAFRFERPRKGKTVGLALSPTRVPDFHAADNAAIVELGG